MFNFFKKNKPSVQIETSTLRELTADEIAQIEHQINELKQQLTHTDDVQLLASCNEQIGILYNQLRRVDLAMEYLETSMQQKRSIGEGYKILMSLYNHKRAEAAKSGSITDIDFWMNKMDEMRNIAKLATIQRN
ncbi:hypothetical protein B6D17_00115 [Gilliamella apis]|uniref:hypothetical protein n=1 Tax=Gilliamella apis TaxID=1970738 RepID=UPI000A341409|nr:hypothetical protein [Gilliamella apis]OTQ72388.1 hypothetical protein B6D17_00115 [Gilliamella apis]OTQ73172.1 hypothetical protein B6C90_10240 [Gilliamella apis]